MLWENTNSRTNPNGGILMCCDLSELIGCMTNGVTLPSFLTETTSNGCSCCSGNSGSANTTGTCCGSGRSNGIFGGIVAGTTCCCRRNCCN